jgi:hypothetical protein
MIGDEAERRRSVQECCFWLNGAAQESNLPAAGSRRLTGFEDEVDLAQPRRSRGVRARRRASKLGDLTAAAFTRVDADECR